MVSKVIGSAAPSFVITADAGTVVLATDSNIGSVMDGSWVKLAEIKLKVSGAINTSFQLRSSSTGSVAGAKIYRNGSAVGTTRNTTSTTYVTFTEDISGWNVGDLYQIYGDASQTDQYVYVTNLKVQCATITPTPANLFGEVTL